MRAWQVGQHGAPREALRLVDIEPPTPGPGEVLLRVRAVAIGMPDAFMCRATYALTPKLPFVPGQEVCGTVDAVGEGVDIPLGTRLMAVTNFFDGRGGFAEFTIARAMSAFRVPDNMSDVDAACFRIGFSTAWVGLVRRGAMQSGDTLLVLGAAGGSGATAVQLGHALGGRVIAVAAGAEKLAFCKTMGADILIDREREAVPEAALAATNRRGVDLVYDPVGGAAAEASTKCIAHGGRLLAVGFASGTWAQVNTAHLVMKSYSLVGVYAGGWTREQTEADHEALLALAAEGKLASFAHTVSFGDLPSGVAQVADGSVIGKTVVVLDD